MVVIGNQMCYSEYGSRPVVGQWSALVMVWKHEDMIISLLFMLHPTYSAYSKPGHARMNT